MAARDATPTPADPRQELAQAVAAAITGLAQEAEATAAGATFERPADAGHGHYSSNAAMRLAPVLGQAPRDIAAQLGDVLLTDFGGALDTYDVAGPGFLNLKLSSQWLRGALSAVLAAGSQFGKGQSTDQRVLIEFVSANPTGPLTAAGGRHAAYGDALANVVEFAGATAEREYYINDYGSQVLNLGRSVLARAKGEEPPEDGYQGEYVTELAAQIKPSDDPTEAAERAVELMVAQIKAALERFGVKFDTWFSERSLHGLDGDDAATQQALELLAAAGHTYERDGALWLRSTDFGDDKDRVLRRSDGALTYFAADIAYHQHKRARGFDRLIDIWGADHHGYVPRMKAAFAALGDDPERLEVVIMQFVNLIESGERASMSKRRGDFVTLNDLVDEIGVDAARFLMLQRSHDTTVDLDLDLARSQSSENPVYYVQYAHARIQSILRKAAAEGSKPAEDPAALDYELHPSEELLILDLLEFPAVVAAAAERRAPHRVATYALELAQSFTAFYRDCKVVGAESPEAEAFRLALCAASGSTVKSALGLLGVSAPEEM